MIIIRKAHPKYNNTRLFVLQSLIAKRFRVKRQEVINRFKINFINARFNTHKARDFWSQELLVLKPSKVTRNKTL